MPELITLKLQAPSSVSLLVAYVRNGVWLSNCRRSALSGS